MNEMITKIENVDELDYISNSYIISKEESYKLLSDFEANTNIVISPDIKKILAHINGKAYYDWVLFRSKVIVPVFDGNIGDIGLFYSLKNGMQYSTFPTMKSNCDIIEKTDFLFAEATPGDFLVISLDKNDYGKIYFISHDFNENEKCRYLVADSFDDFIDSMFIKEDEK